MAAGQPHAENEHVSAVERRRGLLALASLRAQYPQAGESELRLKLAALLYGDKLARKVYGEASHAK